LQGYKNVVEQNSIKGVPAQSARLTAVLWNPNRPNRAVSVYRLLHEVKIFTLAVRMDAGGQIFLFFPIYCIINIKKYK
jgi:hypothetical protein